MKKKLWKIQQMCETDSLTSDLHGVGSHVVILCQSFNQIWEFLTFIQTSEKKSVCVCVCVCVCFLVYCVTWWSCRRWAAPGPSSKGPNQTEPQEHQRSSGLKRVVRSCCCRTDGGHRSLSFKHVQPAVLVSTERDSYSWCPEILPAFPLLTVPWLGGRVYARCKRVVLCTITALGHILLQVKNISPT